MPKTPRLSKSGIEYLDYSWGIFSGCHNREKGICPIPNCWAKSITTRFPDKYPNGFEPTFYQEAIDSPKYLKKPSRIGVGWVGDVIGYGTEYKEKIYDTIEQCPQHTFLFLTKNPDRLKDWIPFPPNVWVGVTATDTDMMLNATRYFNELPAGTKYISFEPLLWWDNRNIKDLTQKALTCGDVDWLIVGSQTNPTVYPPIATVRELVEAANKAGIPIFLKNNLRSMLCDALATHKIDRHRFFRERKIRQELPNGKN